MEESASLYEFTAGKYLEEYCTKQNEHRINGKFCDWTLRSADGVEIKVHKIVLYSASERFRAMFDGNMKECNEKIFDCKDISGKCLENIVSFMYTGSIVIDKSDIKDIAKNAVFFQLPFLVEYCTEVLFKNIDNNNCLQLWRFAAEVLMYDLKDNCIKYVRNRAESLFGSNSLQNLKLDEIKELLQSDYLNCTEEKIYNFVVKWAKDNTVNEEEYSNTLLDVIDFIRFAAMNETFIAHDVLQNEILINNIPFWKKINEVLKYKWQAHTANQLILNTALRPRIRSLSKTVVGILKDSVTLLSDPTHILQITNIKKHYSSTFINKNFVLISGGTNCSSCKLFSPIIRKIESFPSMNNERALHSTICDGNVIYACGGQENLSSETLHIDAGQWVLGPTFEKERSRFGLTLVGGRLYAFGGGTNSIEAWDPRTSKWEKFLVQTSPFNGATKSVVFDNTIYSFSAKNMYKFDYRMNACHNETTSPVQFLGNSFDFYAFNEYIYAIGFTGESTVMCYRFNQDDSPAELICTRSVLQENTQWSTINTTFHTNSGGTQWSTTNTTYRTNSGGSLFGGSSDGHENPKNVSTFSNFCENASAFGSLPKNVSIFSNLGENAPTFGDLSKNVPTFGCLPKNVSAAPIKLGQNLPTFPSVVPPQPEPDDFDLGILAVYLK